MTNIVRIKMMDKEVELDLPSNVLTQSTIKSQFLLHRDAIVSMSYEIHGRRKGCLMNEAGTAFMLPDGWPDIEFYVESDKAPSQPATFMNMSQYNDDASKPKRQKMDFDSDFEHLPVDANLAASVRCYSLYYLKNDGYKQCVIPLTTKLAATFRHGENKSIKQGDEIVIRSCADDNFKVTTHAVKCIENTDTIILQSDGADICDCDLIFESMEPSKGLHYLQMGFSIFHGNTNHPSLSTGIIASDLTRKMRYIGSSGSFRGDNGGSCWNNDGKLIGMQVEVQCTTGNKDRLSPAPGGRCCIVPMRSILAQILDLLPPESDGESWSE